MKKQELFNKEDLFIGDLVEISYENKLIFLRSILFTLVKDKYAMDLLYHHDDIDLDTYKVFGISGNINPLFNTKIIKDAYNIKCILDRYGFRDELTRKDLELFRKLLLIEKHKQKLVKVLTRYNPQVDKNSSNFYDYLTNKDTSIKRFFTKEDIFTPTLDETGVKKYK